MIPRHLTLKEHTGRIYTVSNAANISAQIHQIASRAMFGVVPNFINLTERSAANYPNDYTGAVSAQDPRQLQDVFDDGRPDYRKGLSHEVGK